MALEIGTKAPDFSLILVTAAGEGRAVSLSDFAGRTLVLFFYPKDDTSGCTAEACQFRDSLPDFGNLGSAIMGVSRDSAKSHAKFIAKYDLTFPARQRRVRRGDRGLWRLGGEIDVRTKIYGHRTDDRSSSTAAESSRKIWSKVKVPGHAEAVLAAVKGLDGGGG